MPQQQQQQQEHSVIMDAPQTVFPILISTMKVQEAIKSFTARKKCGRRRAAATSSTRSLVPTVSGVEVDGPLRKRARVEVKEEEEEGVTDAPPPPPPPAAAAAAAVDDAVPVPFVAAEVKSAGQASVSSKENIRELAAQT